MADEGLRHIEICRDLNRRAAEQYAAHGAKAVDITIAAIYSAHDLAMMLNDGSAIAGVEYLRNALDAIESQILAQSPPAPPIGGARD